MTDATRPSGPAELRARGFNPELEEAIARDPSAPGAYLVYADWLGERGHPLGELIVVQHALATLDASGLGARQRVVRATHLRSREAVLLAKHRPTLLGALEPGAADLGWRYGFVRTAYFQVGHPTNVRELLRAPAGRLVEELSIADAPRDNAALLENLRPPALRELELGREGDVLPLGPQAAPNPHRGRDVSWPVGDVAGVIRALDGLVGLRVAGSDVALGPLDPPPRLQSLEIRTLMLPRATMRGIGTAVWPSLARLVLWIGEGDAGATLGDMEPLLDDANAPALRHLAIVRCPFGDALCRAIAGSRLLSSLESLDLSSGTITNAGAQALAEAYGAAPGSPPLARLDLSGNFVTAPVDLGAIAREVVTANQRRGHVALPTPRGGRRARRYDSIVE